MKRKRILLATLLVLVAIILAGCTGTKLVPVTGSDPQVTTIYVDGRAAALATGDFGLSVAVSGARGDNQLYLHVGYTNSSGERVDAIPEDIAVEVEGSRGRRYLHVYPASAYLDRLRAERNVLLFAQALHALTDRHTTTRIEEHHGYHGHYWTSTTYVQTGPDPDDFFHLIRDARKSERDLRTWEKVLLGRTTLFPAQSVEGVVVAEYDPAYAERFFIKVPFGGEIHDLEFVLEQN